MLYGQKNTALHRWKEWLIYMNAEAKFLKSPKLHLKFKIALSNFQIPLFPLHCNLESWDWHHWKALCKLHHNESLWLLWQDFWCNNIETAIVKLTNPLSPLIFKFQILYYISTSIWLRGLGLAPVKNSVSTNEMNQHGWHGNILDITILLY